MAVIQASEGSVWARIPPTRASTERICEGFMLACGCYDQMSLDGQSG